MCAHYMGGGHNLIYSFIPENEIWLEKLEDSEMNFNLVHELTENLLMKQGLSYDDAHERACMVEQHIRNSGISVRNFQDGCKIANIEIFISNAVEIVRAAGGDCNGF